MDATAQSPALGSRASPPAPDAPKYEIEIQYTVRSSARPDASKRGLDIRKYLDVKLLEPGLKQLLSNAESTLVGSEVVWEHACGEADTGADDAGTASPNEPAPYQLVSTWRGVLPTVPQLVEHVLEPSFTQAQDALDTADIPVEPQSSRNQLEAENDLEDVRPVAELHAKEAQSISTDGSPIVSVDAETAGSYSETILPSEDSQLQPSEDVVDAAASKKDKKKKKKKNRGTDEQPRASTPTLEVTGQGQLAPSDSQSPTADELLLQSSIAEGSRRHSPEGIQSEISEEASVRPPENAIVQRPEKASVQPPEEASIQPPDEAGIQPPEEASIQPPEDASVQPPEDANVQLTEESGVQPTEENQEEPTDEAQPHIADAKIQLPEPEPPSVEEPETQTRIDAQDQPPENKLEVAVSKKDKRKKKKKKNQGDASQSGPPTPAAESGLQPVLPSVDSQMSSVQELHAQPADAMTLQTKECSRALPDVDIPPAEEIQPQAAELQVPLTDERTPPFLEESQADTPLDCLLEPPADVREVAVSNGKQEERRQKDEGSEEKPSVWITSADFVEETKTNDLATATVNDDAVPETVEVEPSIVADIEPRPIPHLKELEPFTSAFDVSPTATASDTLPGSAAREGPASQDNTLDQTVTEPAASAIQHLPPIETVIDTEPFHPEVSSQDELSNEPSVSALQSGPEEKPGEKPVENETAPTMSKKDRKKKGKKKKSASATSGADAIADIPAVRTQIEQEPVQPQGNDSAALSVLNAEAAITNVGETKSAQFSDADIAPSSAEAAVLSSEDLEVTSPKPEIVSGEPVAQDHMLSQATEPEAARQEATLPDFAQSAYAPPESIKSEIIETDSAQLTPIESDLTRPETVLVQSSDPAGVPLSKKEERKRKKRKSKQSGTATPVDEPPGQIDSGSEVDKFAATSTGAASGEPETSISTPQSKASRPEALSSQAPASTDTQDSALGDTEPQDPASFDIEFDKIVRPAAGVQNEESPPVEPSAWPTDTGVIAQSIPTQGEAVSSEATVSVDTGPAGPSIAPETPSAQPSEDIVSVTADTHNQAVDLASEEQDHAPENPSQRKLSKKEKRAAKKKKAIKATSNEEPVAATEGPDNVSATAVDQMEPDTVPATEMELSSYDKDSELQHQPHKFETSDFSFSPAAEVKIDNDEHSLSGKGRDVTAEAALNLENTLDSTTSVDASVAEGDEADPSSVPEPPLQFESILQEGKTLTDTLRLAGDPQGRAEFSLDASRSQEMNPDDVVLEEDTGPGPTAPGKESSVQGEKRMPSFTSDSPPGEKTDVTKFSPSVSEALAEAGVQLPPAGTVEPSHWPVVEAKPDTEITETPLTRKLSKKQKRAAKKKSKTLDVDSEPQTPISEETNIVQTSATQQIPSESSAAAKPEDNAPGEDATQPSARLEPGPESPTTTVVVDVSNTEDVQPQFQDAKSTEIEDKSAVDTIATTPAETRDVTEAPLDFPHISGRAVEAQTAEPGILLQDGRDDLSSPLLEAPHLGQLPAVIGVLPSSELAPSSGDVQPTPATATAQDTTTTDDPAPLAALSQTSEPPKELSHEDEASSTMPNRNKKNTKKKKKKGKISSVSTLEPTENLPVLPQESLPSSSNTPIVGEPTHLEPPPDNGEREGGDGLAIATNNLVTDAAEAVVQTEGHVVDSTSSHHVDLEVKDAVDVSQNVHGDKNTLLKEVPSSVAANRQNDDVQVSENQRQVEVGSASLTLDDPSTSLSTDDVTPLSKQAARKAKKAKKKGKGVTAHSEPGLEATSSSTNPSVDASRIGLPEEPRTTEHADESAPASSAGPIVEPAEMNGNVASAQSAASTLSSSGPPTVSHPIDPSGIEPSSDSTTDPIISTFDSTLDIGADPNTSINISDSNSPPVEQPTVKPIVEPATRPMPIAEPIPGSAAEPVETTVDQLVKKTATPNPEVDGANQSVRSRPSKRKVRKGSLASGAASLIADEAVLSGIKSDTEPEMSLLPASTAKESILPATGDGSSEPSSEPAKYSLVETSRGLVPTPHADALVTPATEDEGPHQDKHPMAQTDAQEGKEKVGHLEESLSMNAWPDDIAHSMERAEKLDRTFDTALIVTHSGQQSSTPPSMSTSDVTGQFRNSDKKHTVSKHLDVACEPVHSRYRDSSRKREISDHLDVALKHEAVKHTTVADSPNPAEKLRSSGHSHTPKSHEISKHLDIAQSSRGSKNLVDPDHHRISPHLGIVHEHKIPHLHEGHELEFTKALYGPEPHSYHDKQGHFETDTPSHHGTSRKHKHDETQGASTEHRLPLQTAIGLEEDSSASSNRKLSKKQKRKAKAKAMGQETATVSITPTEEEDLSVDRSFSSNFYGEVLPEGPAEVDEVPGAEGSPMSEDVANKTLHKLSKEQKTKAKGKAVALGEPASDLVGVSPGITSKPASEHTQGTESSIVESLEVSVGDLPSRQVRSLTGDIGELPSTESPGMEAVDVSDSMTTTSAAQVSQELSPPSGADQSEELASSGERISPPHLVPIAPRHRPIYIALARNPDDEVETQRTRKFLESKVRSHDLNRFIIDIHEPGTNKIMAWGQLALDEDAKREVEAYLGIKSPLSEDDGNGDYEQIIGKPTGHRRAHPEHKDQDTTLQDIDVAVPSRKLSKKQKKKAKAKAAAAAQVEEPVEPERPAKFTDTSAEEAPQRAAVESGVILAGKQSIADVVETSDSAALGMTPAPALYKIPAYPARPADGKPEKLFGVPAAHAHELKPDTVSAGVRKGQELKLDTSHRLTHDSAHATGLKSPVSPLQAPAGAVTRGISKLSPETEAQKHVLRARPGPFEGVISEHAHREPSAPGAPVDRRKQFSERVEKGLVSQRAEMWTTKEEAAAQAAGKSPIKDRAGREFPAYTLSLPKSHAGEHVEQDTSKVHHHHHPALHGLPELKPPKQSVALKHTILAQPPPAPSILPVEAPKTIVEAERSLAVPTGSAEHPPVTVPSDITKTIEAKPAEAPKPSIEVSKRPAKKKHKFAALFEPNTPQKEELPERAASPKLPTGAVSGAVNAFQIPRPGSAASRPFEKDWKAEQTLGQAKKQRSADELRSVPHPHDASFVAALATGLEKSGFDSKLALDDPALRRSSAPHEDEIIAARRKAKKSKYGDLGRASPPFVTADGKTISRPDRHVAQGQDSTQRTAHDFVPTVPATVQDKRVPEGVWKDVVKQEEAEGKEKPVSGRIGKDVDARGVADWKETQIYDAQRPPTSFDPMDVLTDPTFMRRSSPTGVLEEADHQELWTGSKQGKGAKPRKSSKDRLMKTDSSEAMDTKDDDKSASVSQSPSVTPAESSMESSEMSLSKDVDAAAAGMDLETASNESLRGEPVPSKSQQDSEASEPTKESNAVATPDLDLRFVETEHSEPSAGSEPHSRPRARKLAPTGPGEGPLDEEMSGTSELISRDTEKAEQRASLVSGADAVSTSKIPQDAAATASTRRGKRAGEDVVQAYLSSETVEGQSAHTPAVETSEIGYPVVEQVEDKALGPVASSKQPNLDLPSPQRARGLVPGEEAVANASQKNKKGKKAKKDRIQTSSLVSDLEAAAEGMTHSFLEDRGASHPTEQQEEHGPQRSSGPIHGPHQDPQVSRLKLIRPHGEHHPSLPRAAGIPGEPIHAQEASLDDRDLAVEGPVTETPAGPTSSHLQEAKARVAERDVGHGKKPRTDAKTHEAAAAAVRDEAQLKQGKKEAEAGKPPFSSTAEQRQGMPPHRPPMHPDDAQAVPSAATAKAGKGKSRAPGGAEPEADRVPVAISRPAEGTEGQLPMVSRVMEEDGRPAPESTDTERPLVSRDALGLERSLQSQLDRGRKRGDRAADQDLEHISGDVPGAAGHKAPKLVEGKHEPDAALMAGAAALGAVTLEKNRSEIEQRKKEQKSIEVQAAKLAEQKGKIPDQDKAEHDAIMATGFPAREPPAIDQDTQRPRDGTSVPKLTPADFPMNLPVSKLIKDAEKTLADGDTHDALVRFDVAVSRHPNNHHAFFHRGKAYLSLGMSAEAQRDFDKAMAIKPDSRAAMEGQLLKDAEEKLAAGKTQEALAFFDSAILRNPKNYRAYFHRGNAHLNLGKVDEAKRDFEKVLQIKPGYEIPDEHFQRIRALVVQERATGDKKEISEGKKPPVEAEGAPKTLEEALSLQQPSAIEKDVGAQTLTTTAPESSAVIPTPSPTPEEKLRERRAAAKRRSNRSLGKVSPEATRSKRSPPALTPDFQSEEKRPHLDEPPVKADNEDRDVSSPQPIPGYNVPASAGLRVPTEKGTSIRRRPAPHPKIGAQTLGEPRDVQPRSPSPSLPEIAYLPSVASPSAIDSATKERSSHLFDSSPSTRGFSESPTTSAAARPQQVDQYGSPVKVKRPWAKDPPGTPEKQSEKVPTPASKHARTPTAPLDPIKEFSSPEESHSHKKGRDVSDVGAPDRGVKSLRRSTSRKSVSELERPVTPTPTSRRTPREPSSDMRGPDAEAKDSPWHQVHESTDREMTLTPTRRLRHSPSTTDPVKQRLGERPSVDRLSGSGIARHKTPDHTRPLSATSSRASTPSLRRVDRSISGDLRAAAKLGEASAQDRRTSHPSTSDVALAAGATAAAIAGIASSSQKDKSIKGEGKPRAVPSMPDVYEAWGEAQGSSISPTRPPSVRKRQSMQIMNLQSQLEELAAQNQALAEAKAKAEESIQQSQYQRQVDEQVVAEAVLARDREIQQKEVDIAQLRDTLQHLQQEVQRLNELNKALEEANSNLSEDATERQAQLQAEGEHIHQQWLLSSRELEALRAEHAQLKSGMEEAVRAEIGLALDDCNSEVRRLTAELDAARGQIRTLQRQIAANRAQSESFLTVRDEDYFDSACQQLCQHVQQWVLRFSKYSDTRACRLSSEVAADVRLDKATREKIETRLDNSILDGSDVDMLLADRVKRRDVFMSVVMTMIWEYVFTRYLFGMDREQRQKLKSLEKTLSEVGPTRAVAQWRAITLTLLAKRDQFKQQRAQDTEAVVHEIYSTLATLLPPPSHLQRQIQESLRNVMRLAVELSIEMRTQRAEYIMLPPLQPEYDTNGDLVAKVTFNASLMNERSGETTSNDELEARGAIVKMVLFPLVVKKGDDFGEGEDEIVVCPAQVLIAKPKDKKVVRVMSGAMSSHKSIVSLAPESSVMDLDGSGMF